jgi:hypothetical protein
VQTLHLARSIGFTAGQAIVASFCGTSFKLGLERLQEAKDTNTLGWRELDLTFNSGRAHVRHSWSFQRWHQPQLALAQVSLSGIENART